ncbi:hypothetical protein [Thiomicrorhabdus indica]|uniref:hypothetical protein n=1 Tax=Thiomicrorhabdus indica TaxID=2267253 RepID=UPI002AA8B7EC|nr:hypothetical protein [Thiomicrorhabdus indica]
MYSQWYLFALGIVISVFASKVMANEIKTGQDQKTVQDLLAIKISVDQHTVQGSKISQGGGYDLTHSKIEVGNFLLSVSQERFSVNWREIDKLPFGKGITNPHSDFKRYQLKAHVPYRLDSQRMWLGHLGIEQATEKEQSDALTLQGYLLYSEYFSPLHSWQLGAYISHHPVETLYLPIFEYTYNYPFKQRMGFYGHAGFPKTLIGYFITPKVRSEVGFYYHQAMVKLADQSEIAPAGYFQSKNWRMRWRTYYRYTPKLEMHIGIQASIANELRLYNRDYEMEGDYAVKHGVGMNLGMSYRF